MKSPATPKSFVRTFPARREAMADALAFLDETLEGNGCPLALQTKLDVICDEICSNIVKHAHASVFELTVAFTPEPNGVRLVFADDGVAYDPLAHVDPDTTLSAEERPIGGLGILMVKRMADAVAYERRQDRNFFTVFKAIA